MRDGRFALGTVDLRVQMNKTVGDRQTDDGHVLVAERRPIKVVKQRAVRIKVREQPELSA